MIQVQIDSFEAEGMQCHSYTPSTPPPAEGLPLVLLVGERKTTQAIPQMLESVAQAVEAGVCRPFVLATFESQHWERDLTPWPAPALFKKGAPFEGGAQETLRRLLESILPRIEANCPVQPGSAGRSIMGYSLGGLFSLWAALQSGAFAGCACCSGSLWYDGWPAFVEATPPAPGSRIYLSLGRSEERARNPRMAAVGDVTRSCAALFQSHPNVAETTLVWQQGGHFQDVEQRQIEALLWLMKV